MSLDWFDRVTEELQDHLHSICEKYSLLGQMSIDRAAKHPRIDFFVETENDRDYFFSLFFEPHNEEFYAESYDLDLEQTSRTILADIEDIVDAVHESFHDYMDDGENELDLEDARYQIIEERPPSDGIGTEEYLLLEESSPEEEIFEEIDVKWTTPEITAYAHEDEVEITYQFGIVPETGDGVLRRINRIWTTDDELIKDESHFIFSKEEGNTIISMIASHLDSLSEFDFEHH